MPLSVDIYYQIYEEGGNLPVILIHGAGGTHLYWPPEIRRLQGFRVYALDLPGHGKSSGRGYQTIQSYAEAVMNWMDEVGLHRAVFVGHSMGGAIVQMLALNYPNQVLALGLVSSAAKLGVNPAILEGTSSPTTFPTAVETIVSWSFHENTSERLIELAANRMGETRPTVLHGDLVACDAFDVSERLLEIYQPTLIICGDEDKMTPLRQSQYLGDHLGNSRLEAISEAGHMVMLEQPEALAGILRDFLLGISY